MSDVETRGRVEATPLLATTPAAPVRRPAEAGAVRRDEEGSFGRALAAAREARGLTQADVAAQLRLHVRQVKAIENEDLAALPAGPFVRGYLRNYAKLVDLPAEPLLSLLNARSRPTEPLRTEDEGTKGISPIQRMPREPISGRLVIGGAVVALVVFAAFGWWTMRAEQPKEPVVRSESGPAAAGPVPATADTNTAAEPPVEALPAAAEGAAAAAPPLSDTALRLSFRDRSWVEVRQADGAVLLSQNNAPGTVQTVDGVPPYTLVIGNASKVELEFRGKPVDLSASTSRDDVARLRLE